MRGLAILREPPFQGVSTRPLVVGWSASASGSPVLGTSSAGSEPKEMNSSTPLPSADTCGIR